MILAYGRSAFTGGGKCLCCTSEVVPLIDFGSMPLVNTYSVKTEFPLAVDRCVECYHMQLHEYVDPDVLYRHYTYCSGTGRTALDYFRDFARMAVSYVPNAFIIREGHIAATVLDIASNDGSQLDAFKTLGLQTYGVDPAANLCKIARDKGHNITTAFFEEMSTDIDPQFFDIITAQNVLAHTPNPLEFLIQCKKVMDEDSRLFIATSQANIIVNGECDTIYHEHVSYFNAHSMTKLAARAGLKVLDIVMHDIHGTSYVFVLGKSGKVSMRVEQRLEWERAVGMMSPLLYNWWKTHVREKIARIRGTIKTYKLDGYYTVGCGAAAKGISMLNMAQVKLDVIADNTPTKWNKETSGMKIVPFTEIGSLNGDKVLFVVLAWNVGAEIRRNVLALRDNRNDVFIETR
jgi:2-polyprenyl-3-methyl-5-hydroxy-6-metoxy-1,4-benzoquinol methylase